MTGSLRATARHVRERVVRWRTRHLRRGVILLYHRVCETPSDPWGMTVSPENFAGQMRVLARRRDARKMTDLAARLSEPGRGSAGVAVTFDDGYLDNRENALPTLEATGVPATVFVVSGTVGQPGAFWWDRLSTLMLETPRLPTELVLTTTITEPRSFALGSEADADPALLARCAAWRVDAEAPRGPREELMLEIWALLAAMPLETAAQAMDALEAQASAVPRAAGRAVTRDELARLAASPLIEIGGHTRTHPDLRHLAPAEGAAEISRGRAELRWMTGKEVSSFAYPYGRMHPETAEQVRDAGYVCAGTSAHGVATAADDPVLLPRVVIGDIRPEAFEKLLDWLDPR